MHKLSFTLAALLCAGSLCAAPTEPVSIGRITYDTTCEVAGTPLQLNGAGLRKIVFFKVYAGGLYLSNPTTDPSSVFSNANARRVRLGLLRDVDGADFVEALEDGLNANLTPEGKTAIEKEVARLKTVMQTIGDVAEGDLIDFDYVPEKGTVILRNGKPVAEPIPGKALYDAVLAIWLGDKPIDDALKTGMLGL